MGKGSTPNVQNQLANHKPYQKTKQMNQQKSITT